MRAGWGLADSSLLVVTRDVGGVSEAVRAVGGMGAVNLVHVRRRIDVESVIGHVSSPSCARQLPTPYPSWDRDRRSSGCRWRCTAPPSPGAGAAPCRRHE